MGRFVAVAVAVNVNDNDKSQRAGSPGFDTAIALGSNGRSVNVVSLSRFTSSLNILAQFDAEISLSSKQHVMP